MSSSSIDKKEIRRFGTIVLVFFGILAIIGLWRQRTLPFMLFSFLAFIGLCLFLLPGKLSVLYHGWLKIAHVIGRGVTIMILTLAYYLVITPAALIKRIFGGKPLPTSPDRNASTYWIPKVESLQEKERFIKRF